MGPSKNLRPNIKLYILLACGGIILAITMGMRNTFGLFLQPISIEMSIPREVFALAIAIQMLVWGASQPIFGALADRFGSGRIILLGGMFYAGGLVVMATASGPWALHGGMGILIGLGTSAAGFAVILGPIGRAFPPEKRSMALGIASAGGSAGQLVMAIAGGALLTNFGWSASLMILALIALLILPLALGVKGRKGAILADSASTLRTAINEALRHPSFWLLCGGFFVCGFHVAFIATHLPPFISDHNLSHMLSAVAIALIGLFNIFGSISSGWLGGRYPQQYVLTTFYLARALILAIFLIFPVTSVTILIFSAIMGFLWLGTVPLTSGRVGKIYGVRYLGALFGIVFFSHQLGGFLGAWLGGYIYDIMGSYDLVWGLAIFLALLAAFLHLFINGTPVRHTVVQGQ